jgi:hypothetical protein
MENLIAYLRKLFGREESVDSIMKPITKIAEKLERHEDVQAKASQREAEAAERARNASQAAKAAADRARAKRLKVLENFA